MWATTVSTGAGSVAAIGAAVGRGVAGVADCEGIGG